MSEPTISIRGIKQRHFANISDINCNTLYVKEKQAVVLHLLTVIFNSKMSAPLKDS